jgi:uncharacterized membrane protein YqgA involved in biofilm formation
MRGLGTLINLATVSAGGLIGVFAGHRIPESMRRTIMQSLGLAVIAVAVVGFDPLFVEDVGLKRFVIMIACLIVGAAIGELLALEARLEGAGDALRRRFGVEDEDASPAAGSSFVEGFVVASTVFCVGPLTLLGAMEDGLGLSIRLLAIKSTLDGIAATGFAAVYGWGVLGSLITIVVVQGVITAGAIALEPVLTHEILAQLGAIGSVLILGIAFRLLDIVRIPIANLLPAVPLAMIVAGVVEKLN